MSMTRNSISGIPFAAAAAITLASSALAASNDLPVAAVGGAEGLPAQAGLPVGSIGPDAPVTAPDRLAQYAPYVPPRGRPVSDHDHALDSARTGENRGFEELMRSAQARGRGEYLGVEPDISRNVYRFKFLRSGGNVVWVDVDGRTGRVIAERD